MEINKELGNLLLKSAKPQVAKENKTIDPDPVLSEEQKLIILKFLDENPNKAISVREMVEKVWGAGIDARSKKGLAVRKYLVEKKISFSNTFGVEKQQIELTNEQQEFIINNCHAMKSVEMAKALFPDIHFTLLKPYISAVSKFLKELDPKVTQDNLEDISDNVNYQPPKTLLQAAGRVNKYILDCIKTDEIKNNATLQKNLKALIRFCHLNRFKMLVDNYTSEKDKSIFEGSYIRYIWDKPDLTEEELDLYINLCSGIVDNISMKAELQDLQQMRQDCADDTEGKRFSMTIVESIEDVRKAIDDNEKRQKELVNVLQGKRTQRIDIRTKQDHSLIQLVEYVRNYDNRQQLILLAKKRQGEVKDEIKRLENMNDAIVQIWGIQESEIV